VYADWHFVTVSEPTVPIQPDRHADPIPAVPPNDELLFGRFDRGRKVFLDGREEMHGEPGWQEAIDELGDEVVLVHRTDSSRARMAEASGWEEAYADDFSVLFARVP
jgi:uncharacterized protein YihD (DUF1040 family)